MRDVWGEFDLTTGRAIVGDDAISIRSRPSELLAGQLALFRRGNTTDRLIVLVRAAAVLAAHGFMVLSLHQLVVGGLDTEVVIETATVGVGTASLWHRFGRDTMVPVATIREATVRPGDRRFELVYDRRAGPLSRYLAGPASTRLRFRTAADAHEAREILRARGIEVTDGADDGPTTYRVETRNGVVFCERCESQVSPSDRTCPACDYALHVEQTAEKR